MTSVHIENTSCRNAYLLVIIVIISLHMHIYTVYTNVMHTFDSGVQNSYGVNPWHLSSFYARKLALGHPNLKSFYVSPPFRFQQHHESVLSKKLPPEKINQVTRPKQSGRFSQNLFDHSFSIYDEYIMPWNSPTNCLHWVFSSRKKKLHDFIGQWGSPENNIPK